jgi:TolB-like protein
MNRTIFAAILFWVSAVSLPGLPKVAVLDIIPQAKIDASVIVPITESLMEEVVSVRAYIVLDRAYIEKVLAEQAFQLTTMVSDTDAAQAGQYLGADYVITGKVQVLGDAYFLVARMIEVRTGIIVSQATEQGEGSDR